jgi:DMSO/TMAO reductase YedYZ molybdopterin-dependent catalytic subunit
VSLATLLGKAQPRENARFVRFLGADGYFREIPIAKALHPSTLLAFRMNGVKLPPAHGFPVRAIVPGWYGMDSVKWLRAVEVVSSEDGAMPAAFRYRRRHRSLLLGAREGDPVTAMNVKSAFTRPVDGAIITGRRFTIRGVAWAGEERVQKVEVSVDGGKTWNAATAPAGSHQIHSWVPWQYQWTIPKKGDYELLVRASDESGRTQAMERASDRVDGYELNTCQTVRVAVT